ncbi:MAG: hypothetical protein IKX55_07000 [Bacteroidaceae bacterium]|nr:hypothetical protein [Bacteroidaceae bacterium]MBR5707301.1 hypothetical protein [Bacteroidaceae bacterium]
MKALRIIPALLIVITTLFACNKDDEKEATTDETGKWYAYNDESKQDVVFYLELKDGKADFMICAWGDRYQGPYTLKDGKISISISKFLWRGNAAALGDAAVRPDNLFNGWSSDDPDTSSDENSHSPSVNGPVVEFEFSWNGDEAIINYANRPVKAFRQ